MAFAAVTSVLGIVEQQLLPLLLLLHQPPQHLINLPAADDTPQIVRSLHDNLRSLQAFLQQESMVEWGLNEEIRRVAIKAEYRIESKVGKVYLAANEGLGVEAACEDLKKTLQKIVKHIEKRIIFRDLDLPQKTHTKYELEDDDDDDDDDGGILIGAEDGVEKIKNMLLLLIKSSSSSSTQLQVVPIWGFTGTGKTTLAKRTYEDPSVVSHFNIRAWTVGSKQYSMRKLLIGILGCIMPLSNEEEISKKDDEQLAEQLCKLLMGQRYLIVIDDLWTTKALDELMSKSFPDENNGSRVLIATTIMEVAEFASSGSGSGSGSGMCIYETRLLDLEERWNLLSKTASSNGKCCLPPECRLIGRRIVEKCNGTPLLIVLIGGLLATLNNSPEQWEDFERVFNMFASSIFDFRELEAVYQYLPSHLKACFLYLGAFPTTTEIRVKKLIKLWVAEGFLKPEMNKSLEEIAEDCLCDLINRRLIQVRKRSLDGKIKSCMVHGFLDAFCLMKAGEEDIMKVYEGEHHFFFGNPRCVSLQSGGRWPIIPSINYLHSIRSFLYFCDNLYGAKCWLKLSSLKFLRVLDLSLIKYWHGMPSEIVDLIHLRYLALTTIGSLYNSQLFKLQSLQTLILSSWSKECQLQVPCDVLDLPWLRHACFDKGSSSYLPNLVQENLQTLSWFKVTGQDSRKTNFTKVPNLNELGIYIEGEVLPNALDNLAQLRQLEKLKVKMGRVERFNLPNCFPSNLKQLTLSNTYLSWEEMDIIGKLPNLDLLKLKDFAFCGPKWKPRDGGFLQLRFFIIEHSDLEHWNANASHFPILERLILRYCWDLEKLPNDFEEVYTLRLIELDNCCSSLVTSAMEIQKWRRESGNEALVVRDVTKAELPTDKSSGKMSESSI